MKTLKKTMIAAVVASTAGTGMAIPSAYVSKYGSLFIENSTNSTLLRDTEKSQTVWVLPPTAGKTVFQGLVPNANLGFCPGIQQLMQASNSIEARIARLAQRYEDLEPELKTAEEALIAAQSEFGELAESEAIRAIMDAQDRVADLTTERNELIDQLEGCTEACEEIRQSYQETSDALRAERDAVRALERDHRDESRAYRRAQNKVAQAESSLDTVGTRVDRIRRQLLELNGDVFNMYANKGRLEGGIAQIDYDTGWDDNVQTLENRYGNYDFKHMPASNVRINANMVGAGSEQSYYESLPMILDYTIQGTKYVPWGEEIDHTESAFPSKMVGNIRLSTLGACPIADAAFFEGTGFTPDTDALSKPRFAISATYQYPVAFKYKVTASYNLYKFYEQIKRSGSSGGFFSTKSYSEVIENRMDRDSFDIDWTVEDPDSEFDAETRGKIRAQLKKELVDRVLQMMAEPVVNGTGGATFVDPGVPPKSGAVVLADGLNKTCGFNFYCQVGGFVLRGLNAIFGSSSMEQTFRSTHDVTASETWSAETAKYRAGNTSFSR